MSQAIVDTLSPGASVGRYTILRRIGSGGMGSVYEGQHRDLGKRAAVKTLHAQYAESPAVRARFVREGQAASRIRHPHVVDVYDVGVEGSTPYLVMEYLEGEDLAGLLRRVGRLPPEQLADLMVPVIAAVAVAHDLGVVHRDLKPENIFLASGRGGGVHPKVLDFGISKIVEEGAGQALTGTAALLGTPLYMSPEQAQGAKNVDARADQYSLGVILYEASVGARPFGDEALFALMTAIISGRFEPPRKRAPDVPEALEALILRAMATEPADRFPSVRALGRAVLAFASEKVRLLYSDELNPVHLAETHPAVPAPAPVLTPAAEAGTPAINTLGSAAQEVTGAGSAAPRRSPLAKWAGVGGVLAAGALILFLLQRGTGGENGAGAAHGGVPEAPAAVVLPPKAPPAETAPVVAPPVTVPIVAAAKLLRTGRVVAQVFADGKLVGITPVSVTIPAGQTDVTVELRAAGYRTSTRKVLSTDPAELDVELPRSPTPTQSTRPRTPSLAPR